MLTTIQNYIQSFMRRIKGNELYVGIGFLLLLLGLWWMFGQQQPIAPITNILDDSDEGMVGGGSDKQLVLYYADWCGHCQTLKPKWDELAAKYNGTQVGGYNVTIDKVNGDEFPEKTQELQIKGFPTIIMYKDGEKTVYTGDRSMESLEEFVRK